MHPVTHAITHLTLAHFRNYRGLALDVSPQPVVLIGHNGAGKTNILEAISLFAPGRGLRGAKLKIMDSQLAGGGNAWVVAAQVLAHGQTFQIGTGRDAQAAIEKRLIKINGEKIRTQSALVQAICVQWLTPSMDQVFIEGNTARRKLLDRLVYGFDPEHATRIATYEQAMRERNRLLADRGMQADSAWLTVLERQMAELSVAMVLARLETLERLRITMQEEIAGFPTAQLALHGLVETALAEGQSALSAEQLLVEELELSRMQDARSGRCAQGAHKSSLTLIHAEKSMPIELCSTGEQKSVLLALMLAAAVARRRWCGLPPILLLDEVVAHLDVDKRGRLFDLIGRAGIQAWMTGTDAADFQGISQDATLIKIAGGTVQ